jgi:hypothetical protein
MKESVSQLGGADGRLSYAGGRFVPWGCWGCKQAVRNSLIVFAILRCNKICEHPLIHMQNTRVFPIEVFFLCAFFSTGCQLRDLELIICLQENRL